VKLGPIILVDACVLHSACCRDLLIQCDIDGHFRLRWTELILAETEQSILRRRPDLTSNQIRRTFKLMNQACPEALQIYDVQRYRQLKLPDPDDNHILTAAISTQSEIILTFNLKDFPSRILNQYQIKAQHPDDWLSKFYQSKPSDLLSSLEKCRTRLSSPALSIREYKSELKKCGLTYLSSLFNR